MKVVLKTILIILGLYLVIDGIGSIFLYQTQPWFPDHTIRVVRAIIGVGLTYLGVRF